MIFALSDAGKVYPGQDGCAPVEMSLIDDAKRFDPIDIHRGNCCYWLISTEVFSGKIHVLMLR